MTQQEKEQVLNLITNFETANKKIPYLADLLGHPVFWPIFKGLSKEQQQEVEQLITEYITNKLQEIKKTKGWQLFNRFAESQSEVFWRFRELNQPRSDEQAFQTLGHQVESEMFKLEGILTEKMLKQEKGLDKVVDAFYTIVYLFFPRFNEIGQH